MNLKPNYTLPCLPTPQDYLGRKRQTILNKYIKMNKQVKAAQYQLYALKGLTNDLKFKYEKIDYQLAEIDGRLKREAKAKAEIIKKKNSVKNKVTSIGYTTEQIASIALALEIELG